MDDIFCPKHGHRYVFDYSADAAHPENQCVICIRDDNLALRARLAQVEQELAQANERHGHWAEMAERAHKETTARAEKAEQFREAVIDALVVSCIYVEEHDTNPRKAINDLICWEQKIALDPAVSSNARALIERAVAGCAEDCAIQVAAREKAEQENAKLREALAELVRLKEWKDELDQLADLLTDECRDEKLAKYRTQKLDAWAAARTALGGEE